MTVLNQGERLAVLESQAHAHAREHALLNDVLAAKLETIETRLAGIERSLVSRGYGGNGSGGAHSWRPSRRDVGVTSVAVAVATAVSWALEQVARTTRG